MKKAGLAAGRLAAVALAAGLTAGLAVSPARAQTEGSGTGRPGFLNMGGLLVFANVNAPLSLVALAAKPKDAVDAGEVFARGCQRGLAIPIAASLRATTISGAAGNGGYDRALTRLRLSHPELKGLYDVRVDAHVFSILGFYRSLCVEITARGYR